MDLGRFIRRMGRVLLESGRRGSWLRFYLCSDENSRYNMIIVVFLINFLILLKDLKFIIIKNY